MSKQPPPAPTASAVGPSPTVIRIVGRPGTGSLPSTIAPPAPTASAIGLWITVGQKQLLQKFKTPKVRVTSIDSQFDADLSDVNNIAKDNDGIRYLLFVIDIFSRFLWVKPLKNKTAKSVLDALKEVLKKRKPVRMRVDKGSEFVNRWVKKYLKDNDIYLFVTQSS